jgi:glycosyltransferase involved in cell wall biosynthesis
MQVDYYSEDSIKKDKLFGIGRYENEILSRLSKMGVEFNFKHAPQFKNPILRRISKHMLLPLVSKKTNGTKIALIGHQTLGFLLNTPLASKYEKTAITCYDLVSMQPEYRGSKIKDSVTDYSLNSMKKADAIISVSASIKAELVEKLHVPSEKIAIIDLAVDCKEFAPRKARLGIAKKYGIPTGKKIVLYVGSEEPRKNMPILIEALFKVRGEFIFVKVGKAGWRDGRQKTIALLTKYGLLKKSMIIDYVDEADLPLLYNLAAVFVYPCKYPTVGLPPLEAMATGVPCVLSSDKYTYPEARKAAICCDPQNSDEFAAGIARLLKNPSLCKSLSKKGRKFALGFSWDLAAKKYFSILKHLEFE